MSNEYSAEIRQKARRLWLTGQFNDREIAATLGIPRPDTIRDWRHEENWGQYAATIREVIESEVKSRIQARRLHRHAGRRVSF